MLWGEGRADVPDVWGGGLPQRGDCNFSACHAFPVSWGIQIFKLREGTFFGIWVEGKPMWRDIIWYLQGGIQTCILDPVNSLRCQGTVKLFIGFEY